MAADEHTTGEDRGGGWPGGPVRPLDAAGLMARGFLMGMADVVPGVSGGTIAFITGVYERFIEALRSITPAPLADVARGRPGAALRRAASMHWGTLGPLAAGILLALVLMSGLILHLMENERGPTYAFFFGLILASAWLPISKMTAFRPRHGAILAAMAAGAWFVVGLQSGGAPLEVARTDTGARTAVYPSTIREDADYAAAIAAIDALPEPPDTLVLLDRKGELTSVDVDPRVTVLGSEAALEVWLAEHGDRPLVVLRESRGSLAWIFVCGTIAISAMILPGISGSFLLLFLGQYHAVLGAMSAMKGHAAVLLGGEPGAVDALAARSLAEDGLFLGTFLVGVVVGLGTFSRVVSWLFRHAHDATMAALTGIMLGALRLPASEATTEGTRLEAAASWGVMAAAAVVGALLVLGLHLADAKFRKPAAPRPDLDRPA